MEPLLSDIATERRMQALRPYLRGNVLDIGCGFTKLPELLSANQRYIGIDMNPRALEYCAECYPGCTFYRRDLDKESINLSEKGFDTVIMGAVIEHLHRPERILTEIRTYLTLGGVFVATTPSPLGDLGHKFGSRIRLFYPEEFLKHVKVFSRRELIELFVACGYQVENFHYFSLGFNQLIAGKVSTK